MAFEMSRMALAVAHSHFLVLEPKGGWGLYGLVSGVSGRSLVRGRRGWAYFYFFYMENAGSQMIIIFGNIWVDENAWLN